MDGVVFGDLEIAIDEFSYDRKTSFWVFSQLYAKTTTLWFKSLVHRKVSLISTGAAEGYEPIGHEISLPNIFVDGVIVKSGV